MTKGGENNAVNENLILVENPLQKTNGTTGQLEGKKKESFKKARVKRLARGGKSNHSNDSSNVNGGKSQVNGSKCRMEIDGEAMAMDIEQIIQRVMVNEYHRVEAVSRPHPTP
ncbi:hypothetical protein M5689_013221 [Euphorbia peplus]|nr:hypothetical protein M5689_013221 [Euphorbia peplus]